MTSVRARTLAALGIAALTLGVAGLATAAMRSEKLGPLLCETTGGGRFVKIPGFRGEKIDRRAAERRRLPARALQDLRDRRLLARPGALAKR